MGSYINLLIYRVPRDLQTVSGPSYCTSCHNQLELIDLIPVFSYALILRGKCRHCGEKVSPRYLIVELISAFSYVALYLGVGAKLELPAYLVLASTLLALSYIDWQTHRLPSKVTYWGGGASVLLLIAAYLYYGDYSHILWMLIGAGILGGYMFIVWFIYPKGMGFGDVKLSFVIGAIVGGSGAGVFPLILAMLISFGGQVILGVLWGLVSHKNLRTLYVPFGPALAVGALCAILWGHQFASLLHSVASSRA